jgi:hypothetical protein
MARKKKLNAALDKNGRRAEGKYPREDGTHELTGDGLNPSVL